MIISVINALTYWSTKHNKDVSDKTEFFVETLFDQLKSSLSTGSHWLWHDVNFYTQQHAQTVINQTEHYVVQGKVKAQYSKQVSWCQLLATHIC